MIDIGKLEVGMIIKNYKEFCALLGQEVKAGNSKKSQMKEWECYFKFHKDGNKFVVDEIYDMPLKREDDKTTVNRIKNINRGIYSKEVFPLIKNYVEGTEKEFHSKTTIMKELGLVNDNYNYAMNNPKKCAEYISEEFDIKIYTREVNYIVEALYSISCDKIDNAFKNLEKLDYIYCYNNKILCVYDKLSHTNTVATNKQYEILIQHIYNGSLEGIWDYFKNKGRTMEEYEEFIKEIKNECIEFKGVHFYEKMVSKLNVELFLRGITKQAKQNSLRLINIDYPDISSYNWSYGYIKNLDIEWEDAKLDEIQNQLHIDNFKKAVKEEYILNTFINRWFGKCEKEYEDKNVNIKKREFKKIFNEIKKESVEKFKILSDVFIDEDCKVSLNKYISKKNKKRQECGELPF